MSGKFFWKVNVPCAILNQFGDVLILVTLHFGRVVDEILYVALFVSIVL